MAIYLCTYGDEQIRMAHLFFLSGVCREKSLTVGDYTHKRMCAIQEVLLLLGAFFLHNDVVLKCYALLLGAGDLATDADLGTHEVPSEPRSNGRLHTAHSSL